VLLKEEDMEKVKVSVSKASEWDYKETIELETLQDFLNFVKNLEEVNRVIVSYDKEDDSFSIMIYDEYVE
jgi:nanoRNase/pAp phosphatase (c-di-AMP/oligoRNAs hydrolase)